MIIIIINTGNVAYENRSDPCGCWRAWYSKEGESGKHIESIKSSWDLRESPERCLVYEQND